MKYQVTLIYHSDYCQLKPSDPKCHRTTIVEADSKVEAVLKVHEPMIDSPGYKRYNIPLPEVWSVDMVK